MIDVSPDLPCTGDVYNGLTHPRYNADFNGSVLSYQQLQNLTPRGQAEFHSAHDPYFWAFTWHLYGYPFFG